MQPYQYGMIQYRSCAGGIDKVCTVGHNASSQETNYLILVELCVQATFHC